jgi:hypothetical protein
MLNYVHMNEWIYVAVKEQAWAFDWAKLIAPLPTIQF